MPFHIGLLGTDRLALYSFIHSLNTNFGTSVFEPVAVALAKSNYADAKAQEKAGDYISAGAFQVIQAIMTDLTAAQGTPDKAEEIERIRAVCRAGEMIKVKPTKIDVFVKGKTASCFCSTSKRRNQTRADLKNSNERF